MRSRYLIIYFLLMLIPSLSHGDIIYSIDFDTRNPGIQSSIIADRDDLLVATVVLELTAQSSLSVYGASLQYDSNELSFQLADSATKPPPGLDPLSQLQNPSLGIIKGMDGGALGLGPTGPATFEIATLIFRVLAPFGDANDVDLVVFEDTLFDGAFDNDGLPLAPTFHGASVISSVPEPSSFLVVSLATLMMCSRRRK